MNKEIIVVTETLGVDGPERVITELIDEWLRMGFAITVAVTRAELRKTTYEMNQDVGIIYIDAHKKGGPLSRITEALEVRKILKKHPNALGISLMISTSFSLAVASIGLKNKIILSERNDPHQVPFTKLQRKMRDFSMELADACVFQTQDAKDYFPKRIQKKGTIIFNPVNPALPERFIGERRKAIIAVGRLEKQKNFSMLIKAFAKVSPKHSDYKLYIYGEGSLRPELEQLIDQYGLKDTVLLPGFSSNVYQEMLPCTAYVSSSDFEGMSNSMLEALAMGIPTVCTDCPIGGARTVIENETNGLLVPVGDADRMAEAITRIIEDPRFAEKLSDNACLIRDKLNIQSIAKQWAKLF